MGNANPEAQKPYTEIGRLNAEIITNKELSESDRNELKRKVNKLMNRDFYKNVPGEKTNE